MDFKTLNGKIQELNLNSIIRKVFDDSAVKDFIIERNQEQLYYRGIDAKGNIIRTFAAIGGRVYANRTIAIKEAKGQPTNEVTLKDTGRFYKSFNILTKPEYAEINANFVTKGGENISANLDTTNVLGLTTENIPLLVQFVKPYFLQNFKNALMK